MNPHYNWILEGSSFHNLELFHLRTLRTCFYIEENSHSNRQVKSNPKRRQKQWSVGKKNPRRRGKYQILWSWLGQEGGEGMLQPILKGIWQILNQTESFLDRLPETTIGFNLSVAISNTNGGISLTSAFSSRKIAGLYNDKWLTLANHKSK